MPKNARRKKPATKRRKRVKQVHQVRAELSVPQLAKAGASLDLEIYANAQKIGTLVIGRGSLYWSGRHRQISKRISWTRFADMMDELAYG